MTFAAMGAICPKMATLPNEHKIKAVASELNLQPQPKTGSKTWVRLIAKVYEVDPLKCEGCGAQIQHRQNPNSPRRRS
jgi:hypothetical protein